ncbi:hypothetical protein MKW94_027337 [Papaver nudicaule]|uniref:Uncharacterized protein n=1 Tax=Papaver nudicaule TaxID=74823 RepID=A0AA41SNM3_PAPNU|nr:hypothetical protein [Papaver nudicaule]
MEESGKSLKIAVVLLIMSMFLGQISAVIYRDHEECVRLCYDDCIKDKNPGDLTESKICGIRCNSECNIFKLQQLDNHRKTLAKKNSKEVQG